MPFTKQSLVTIKDRIESDIKAEINSPTTFLRRSVFKIISKVLAGAIYLVYDYISYVKDQIFITTSDDENLQLHGSEYGISKNFGTKASGSCTIGGTNGTVIASGTELKSSSGNIYVTTSAATIASGAATLSFQAQYAGTDYNESGGIKLTFSSPIIGVSTSATVTSAGITSGVDEESNDSFRNRILTRKRVPPHGGAEFDYVSWALDYSSSVTRAWCIPEYYGIGTVGVGYVMDNDSPIFPDETERAALRTWMLSHTDDITGKTVGVPVTAEPGFVIIPLLAETLNFTIEIYPNTSDVQTAVTTRLEDLIKNDGGPGETIYLSRCYEAISLSTGELYCKINYPTSDIGAATNRVHVLGTITFEEYVG